MGSLFLQAPCRALDLPQLPFINNSADTDIELNTASLANQKPTSSDSTDQESKEIDQLRKKLELELARQRQNNLQLQQYTKPNKIGRYESQLLATRLRAEGYYASEVNFVIRNDRPVYNIETGPRYHVKKISLQLPEAIAITQDIINIAPGDPLLAEQVLTAHKNFRRHISDNYCLYQIKTEYHVTVDHKAHAANLVFSLEESPAVTIGKISFKGIQSIDEDYLRNRLSIKEGECFNRDRIDVARMALIKTNLVASSTVNIKPPVENRAPIEIVITERHHRTIGAGIGYESDDGVGISGEWEHRNMMNRGQKLTFDILLAQQAQNLSSKITIPNFKRNEQSITFYTDLKREDTDAFESKTGTIGIELARQLRSKTIGYIGIEQALSSVLEDGEKDRFALLSLPVRIDYDQRNDPLDPQSGWVISGRIQPYLDTHNTSATFIKSTLAASTYITLNNLTWRPTFAIRGATGSISGIDRKDVPADIRFYTGGGGSVRGYPFQSLGPLTDDDPDGGLSFTEVSLETRLRWGKNWGGVIFLDGGTAYEDESPQWGKDFRWGTGVGVRYYNRFAPFRFDLGVPLDKRDGVDDDFQLYISIGQAF
jgi:translocation and assembly module TamA